MAIEPSGDNDIKVDTIDSITGNPLEILNSVNYAVSGGSANAQTLTFSPTIAALVDGQTFTFRAGFTNTGAATLQVDSTTARSIKNALGDDITSGTIQAGGVYVVTYNSSGTPTWVLQQVLPEWVDWTPSYDTGTTTGQWSSITTDWAKYLRVGNLIHVSIRALGTLGGSIDHFTVSTPMTLVNAQAAAANVHMGSSFPVAGSCIVSSSGSVFVVHNYDKSTITSGAGNRGVNMNAIFRVA